MKTERKGYQKAVLVIAVFTILAGALYATDNFRKIPQNKSGSSILKRNEHGQGEKNQKLVAKTKDQKAENHCGNTGTVVYTGRIAKSI